MRTPILTIVAALAMALSIAGNATATYLDGYSEITIYDRESDTSDWHGSDEDQEVEPDAAPGQQWDLEGFFQNGNSIAMVGGFDFVNGEPSNGAQSPIESGDLFVDTTGDAGDSRQGDYGYEYVLDMDFANKSYDVIQLDDNAQLEGVFTNFTSSNPYRYTSGGEKLYGGVTFEYETGLSDEEVGFLGVNHNGVKINVSFLAPDTPFTLHFTQACGNDNLMGHGATAPVPEPATMILFGTGLMGLAGIGRRNMKGKAKRAGTAGVVR